MVYVYSEILLSHKQEQNNAICSNVAGNRGYHTKGSKSERERQVSYDINYVWEISIKSTHYRKMKDNVLSIG